MLKYITIRITLSEYSAYVLMNVNVGHQQINTHRQDLYPLFIDVL